MTPAKIGPRQSTWGVYVHFPWCLKKCPYCDFLSVPVEPQRLIRLDRSKSASATPTPVDAATARAALPHRAYADAVLRELEARVPWLPVESAPRTLFFGGGTPSLWEPEELGRIIDALRSNRFWPAPGDLEVTVECNPTSFDEELARRLLDVGVNRISLGVQSLDAARLQFLGRLHDAAGALTALDAAQRAGVPRVSADLIFGVAGQTPEAAAQEVRRLAETGISHLSAYALTIEPNTFFGTLARRGKLPLLEDDLVAESFVAVERTLEDLGFAHYEVSNYCRPRQESLHNLGYWRGNDYLGLGTGAWGTVRLGTGTLGDGKLGDGEFDGERIRYRNTASVERYLDVWSSPAPAAPFAAGPHLAGHETIDGETALRERIMLGLRLEEGLDMAAVGEELGVDPWTPERRRASARLLETGRLTAAGTRIRIPRSQWLFADGIIAELI